MKRTTVSFEDDQYEILEKWADKEIRTVPNLITAIVVSVLRGETPKLPELEDNKSEGK
jgi:predicted DNA-binding ribbon-helix-helix protein